MKQTVLALIPIKPTLHPVLADRAAFLARQMLPACPDLDLTIVMDGRGVASEPTDNTPWSKVARIRNMMLQSVNLQQHKWVMWIDADLIDYPADLAQWLVHGAMQYANNGVCAPTVLIEGRTTFYDWAAFINKGKSHIDPTNRVNIPGRNISCQPPYYAEEDVRHEGYVEMDCVGACYVVHRDIYLSGTRHTDHASFTDHFEICAKALEMGRKVVALPNVIVTHADLPRFGEKWH